MSARLPEAFRGLGQRYLHRNSTLGDRVAFELYEDLYALDRSSRYRERVDSGLSVLNTRNRRRGIRARRGDGAFGEIVPGVEPVDEEGFTVLRGQIAMIQIAVEVKIMMKAMIKQIDRVVSDLKEQARQFDSQHVDPIRLGVVGVNHAAHCTTCEGERAFSTDGRRHKHPSTEAPEAIRRLKEGAASAYDEFLVLRFETTNEEPFSFSRVDENEAQLDYNAVLVRIAQACRERG